MIPHIDLWLDQWAQWSRQQSDRLGHASASPIHTMMTKNAATTSKSKHRAKRHMLDMGGSDGNHRYVQRDIAPMRAVESSSGRRPSTIDNPLCEMMDDAVSHLEPRLKEAVILRYKCGFNNELAGKSMKSPIGMTRFKGVVDASHNRLDGFLCGRYPDRYDEAVRELKSLIGVLGR
jgi:DNA-directed RNA polymerase specialized sigma24 family protein